MDNYSSNIPIINTLTLFSKLIDKNSNFSNNEKEDIINKVSYY